MLLLMQGALRVLVLLTVGAVQCLATDDPPVRPISFEWTSPGPYDGQGALVEGPAEALGVMSLVFVGAAAALVCVPGDLAYGIARWEWSYGALSNRCAEYVGGAAGWSAYVIAGAPFFVVRKIFWDAPRSMLDMDDDPEETKPGVVASFTRPRNWI